MEQFWNNHMILNDIERLKPFLEKVLEVLSSSKLSLKRKTFLKKSCRIFKVIICILERRFCARFYLYLPFAPHIFLKTF